MIGLLGLNDGWMILCFNHLWQSTIFGLSIWLPVRMLKDHNTQARFWLWMTASIKFLIPFSLLVAAGHSLQPLMSTTSSQPSIPSTIQEIIQPFSPSGPISNPLLASSVSHHRHETVAEIMLLLWACGAFATAFAWGRSWLMARSIVLRASPLALSVLVPVVVSPSTVEPGVFGILNPVLILPEGILDRLTEAQLEAIISHEMCHVRRRDNLTHAVHMGIQTLFWFHPLVWWIGKRLIDERERLCDEAVLRSGSAPKIYAESILNVCKFSTEPFSTCVAGVMGSDLRARIVHIMTMRDIRQLNFGKRVLLGVAGMAVVLVPVSFGLLRSVRPREVTTANVSMPGFDAVSVKPSKPGCRLIEIGPSSDGFDLGCIPLSALIRYAYGYQPMNDDRVLGEPSWLKSVNYDVSAKVTTPNLAAFDRLTLAQKASMLRGTLATRFSLKVHHEERERPVYALTVANGGSKLREANPDDSATKTLPTVRTQGKGEIEAHHCSIADMLIFLSPLQGRTILDETGLTGHYEFTLDWAPNATAANVPPSTEAKPTIFAAVQEQLGLKLEAQKAPLDLVVVDHIERPSAD